MYFFAGSPKIGPTENNKGVTLTVFPLDEEIVILPPAPPSVTVIPLPAVSVREFGKGEVSAATRMYSALAGAYVPEVTATVIVLPAPPSVIVTPVPAVRVREFGNGEVSAATKTYFALAGA